MKKTIRTAFFDKESAQKMVKKLNKYRDNKRLRSKKIIKTLIIDGIIELIISIIVIIILAIIIGLLLLIAPPVIPIVAGIGIIIILILFYTSFNIFVSKLEDYVMNEDMHERNIQSHIMKKAKRVI